jgi:CRP/FNR family transcriptional regulator
MIMLTGDNDDGLIRLPELFGGVHAIQWRHKSCRVESFGICWRNRCSVLASRRVGVEMATVTAIDDLLDLDRLRAVCNQRSMPELLLPAPIEAASLEDLCRIVDEVPYFPGQHVYNIGDRLRFLYIVRSGWLKSSVTSAHGYEQILGFHLPGEIFGLDGLNDWKHRSCVDPLMSARVCCLPVAEIGSLAAKVPGLQRQLMRIISREFAIQEEHVLMMSSRPALERVAFFLQTLLAREVPRSTKQPVTLELGMSRSDVANYLALTRETISRALGRLKSMKLIELHGRKLVVTDPAGLAEVSGELLSLADPLD